MKSIPLLFVAAAALAIFPCGFLGARGVRVWSEQELLDASDLVVSAAPVSTRETKEHTSVGGQEVSGVETEFAVVVVGKGDPAVKRVVLHYYQPAGTMVVANAPTFVSFDLKKKKLFQLFLKREADGRYAPVAGQEDPYLSIREKLALSGE